MSKIYVAGAEIGRSIQKEELDDKFSKFGRVASIWVARQPPGFAFVEFEDARDAEDAVRDMNNTEIQGCPITCEPSRGPGGRDGGGKGEGKGEVKAGDWQCRSCGVNNFARRFECFRCNAPKDDGYGGGGRGGGYGGGYDRYDDRRGGGGGYDDRRGGGGGYDRYDDRRGGGRGDSRDRYDGRRRGDSRDRNDDRRRGGSRDRRDDSRERRADSREKE